MGREKDATQDGRRGGQGRSYQQTTNHKIRMDRWMVRWMDIQKDRQMEGQIDRQTDRQTDT